MSEISEYLSLLCEAIAKLSEDKVQDVVDVLKKAHADGKQVFFVGNGGSAANATHVAEDMQKGVKEHTGKRFKVISLTDSLPLVSAWANDASYEVVFAEQLESLADPGDVLVAISGSGNSPNILRAVEKANEMGLVTVGWTGMSGGKLAQIAQKSIVVASDNMQRIEDVHLVLGHMIYTCMVKSAC